MPSRCRSPSTAGLRSLRLPTSDDIFSLDDNDPGSRQEHRLEKCRTNPKLGCLLPVRPCRADASADRIQRDLNDFRRAERSDGWPGESKSAVDDKPGLIVPSVNSLSISPGKGVVRQEGPPSGQAALTAMGMAREEEVGGVRFESRYL